MGAVEGDDHGATTRGSKIADMLVAVQGAILGGDGDEEKKTYFDTIKSLVMSDIMPDLRSVRDAKQKEIEDAIEAIKATSGNYISESSKVSEASAADAQAKESRAK